MEAPVMHINFFSSAIALYVIGYQITICTNWNWIPMNKEDYKLPYKSMWSKAFQNHENA